MLGTILKPFNASILDTVERISLFALLVFIFAILAGVGSYYTLIALHQEQDQYFNTPFVLEQGREIGAE